MRTETKYNVWYDAAAGSAQICDDRPGHHYDFQGKFDTRELAEAKLAELAGPDVWVLFVDDAAHSAYVRRENDLTGNWRGSRDYPYRAHSEFATKQEAVAAKIEYLKCPSAASGHYCYTHNPDAC